MKNLNKIIEILSYFKMKKNALILIIFTTILLVLDFLSIGSVFPFVLSLVGKENNFKFLGIEFQNFQSNFFLILCVSFFILKNIVGIIFVIVSQNFIWKFYRKSSKELVENELTKNYSEFYLINSSLTIRNLREITISFKQYLETTNSLISEIFSFIAMLGVLLFISLKATLITFIVFLTSLITYLLIFKSRSKRWGEDQAIASGKLNRIILSFRNSFSDILFYNKKFFFLDLYSSTNKEYSENIKKISITSNITRFIFEIIIILFLTYIFFISLSKSDFIDIVPYFSVYIVCVFRMVPALNRILNSNLIRKNLGYTVELMYDYILDIKFKKYNSFKLEENNKEVFSFNKNLRLDNISFIYKNLDKEKEILKNFSLEIKKNSFVGVCGPSGSGKSTLFKILSGLLECTSGNYIFDDKLNINKVNINSFYKKISYVPQKVFLLDDTIKNNIIFGDEFDLQKFNKVIYTSCLDELIRNLPLKENQHVLENSSNFSGGQEQRLAIARALYKDPEILFLDESTNGLDSSTELKIIDRITKEYKKMTIIFATHRIKTLDLCDKIINIK